MNALASVGASVAWNGQSVALDALGVPAAVLNAPRTHVLGATSEARRIMQRIRISLRHLPAALPADLVSLLESVPVGEAFEWNPPEASDDFVLGCTRYALGDSHHFILMRELSRQHRMLSKRLHNQRLEMTGRLVTTIVHDLRAPLASVIFNSMALMSPSQRLSASEFEATIADIAIAANRLRDTVDGLLRFAGTQPTERPSVRVDHVFARVSGLLRPVLRTNGHLLRTSADGDVHEVHGHGLMIEQILVNLVVNAIEATESPIQITVHAERAAGDMVRIRICDDGPGIPPGVRPYVFQPFFTTKPTGTGIGLTTAREAARELGGDLCLEPAGSCGTCFSLLLPAEVRGER